LGSHKKSGASGEGYMLKMEKYLENLIGIDLSQIGQRLGNT
jgi:hypothetical protein